MLPHHIACDAVSPFLEDSFQSELSSYFMRRTDTSPVWWPEVKLGENIAFHQLKYISVLFCCLQYLCFSQFDLKASDKYQSLYQENQHRRQIAFSVPLHRVCGDRERSDSPPSDVAQTARVNTKWCSTWHHSLKLRWVNTARSLTCIKQKN